MKQARRAPESRLFRPVLALWFIGIALVAFHGCASSNGSGAGNNPDAGAAGSGGASSNGSGGSPSGSGGSNGTSSGGHSGSGGSAQGSGGTLGGAGGSSGTGGLSGTGGSSAGSGGSPAPHCTLNIQPLYPNSLNAIEADTNATVRVQGIANGSSAMTLTWKWTISFSASSSDIQAIATINPTGDDAIVEFPVQRPGRYQIYVEVTGDRSCGPAMLTFNASAPQGPSFNFRITAPGLPIQETHVRLADGSSSSFQLDAGQSFVVKPLDPAKGTLLGAYVRISGPNDTFDIEGQTTSMPMMATLLPTQAYSWLIAPIDANVSFAPLLKSALPGAWSSEGLVIDRGNQISAATLTAAGTPIQSARMQLRGGASSAPSTVGISDANGALTLWARGGNLSAIIVPPEGSGLPIVTTSDGSIAVQDGTSLSLTMRWAAMAQSVLTVQALGPDGVSPVANAQVRLVLAGGPYSPGTLTVHTDGSDDVVLPTTASVTENMQTGDDGRVTFPPFPPGAYTVTIIPPAAAAPAAVTTAPVTLMAGSINQTVTLARKVSLTGTLQGQGTQASPPGAKVTAIDVGDACTGTDACVPNPPPAGTSAATGAVFSSAADATGAFTLTVDPDRTYQVIVQPTGEGGRAWGRTVLAPFRVCSTATTPCLKVNGGRLGTVPVPGGTKYTGSLSSDGDAVAGAFVQAFCVSSAPSCVDPTVPLAEAMSFDDGSFTLTLPVPASGAALNK
jgi:hypothetical protein